MLDAPGKLSKILIGMGRVLGEIPLTVKLRTGVKEGKNTAHKLMPRLVGETGVAAITVRPASTHRYKKAPLTNGFKLHGRTRQQRYTKLADWDYIRECVDAVRAREAEEGRTFPHPHHRLLPHTHSNSRLRASVSPIPIFGGGDAFSSKGYWESVEKGGVDGVMVARGALIKPWIFTEIRERREWDISARERLEHVRKVRALISLNLLLIC